MNSERRAQARQIFDAALQAADAYDALMRNLEMADGVLRVGAQTLPLADSARIVVVGAGKAGARMAQAAEASLGAGVCGGLVSVKEGHIAPTRCIDVREAGHPLPDERSLANGQAILDQLQGLTADDVVLFLLSGGGSALIEALGEGLTLGHLRTLTRELMRAGADIVELNTVRKHISLIKGGQLARRAQPATVCALILSDVVGDDLSAIASGPTAPDPTTFADSLEVLHKRGLAERNKPPRSLRGAESVRAGDVVRYLERGVHGEIPDTPKPDDPIFKRVHNVIVGSNRLALEAMAQEARRLGYAPQIVSDALTGEAREVGRAIARLVRERARNATQPTCLLWGGETTVTVRGHGIGGRNHELALGAAIELDGVREVTLLSAATDGGDGSSAAAGAIIDGATSARAQERNLDAERALAHNDADRFFAALGDQVITGPTLTNVNDVVVALMTQNKSE
jgi:glycerate-2-kinase